MSELYLVDLADWLRADGLAVVEYPAWQYRARSSGGYAAGRPWCVMWHHTASRASAENDAAYIAEGDEDSPIANLYVARDGAVWVIAGGATNTNGKGYAMTFSRGTVPDDAMNTYAVGVEIGNDGLGEVYPAAQIDAAFGASLSVCGRLGLEPTDVATHNEWAPDRKIDPATADAATGFWPAAVTSSGTWALADLRAECVARAEPTPAPLPPDPTPPRKDNDMLHVVVNNDDGTPARGPAVIGPGYWHAARNDDEAFVWTKVYGPPLVLDNGYDFDTLVRTLALEPDDDQWLGAGA